MILAFRCFVRCGVYISFRELAFVYEVKLLVMALLNLHFLLLGAVGILGNFCMN